MIVSQRRVSHCVDPVGAPRNEFFCNAIGMVRQQHRRYRAARRTRQAARQTQELAGELGRPGLGEFRYHEDARRTAHMSLASRRRCAKPAAWS